MYNFEQRIDRTNTNAMKLEGYKQYIFGADDSMKLPFADDEFIHMWVADMEFEVAPEIRQAIKERLDRKILGYTSNYDDKLYKAFSAWCKDRYDFEFKQEELVTSDGIVPAVQRLVSYILDDGEKALFHSPAYGQFALACQREEKEFLTTKLIDNGDGSYDLDFEDMDEKMGRDDVKLLILCNPHNPTGRVWSKEELEKIAELVEKHKIWIISDEIHCDLRRKDAPKHIPFGKIMPDYDKLVTCMAASKSFNIAGLQESCVLIRNKELREEWQFKYMGLLNPLSHAGTLAAYTKGGPWLKELNEYLDKNFEFMHKYFEENLPKAVVTNSQTTYLGWVDLKEYFEEDEDLELFFATVAGVLIEADKSFVDHANRKVRLNLACPQSYLKQGLDRIKDALLNKHDEKFLG